MVLETFSLSMPWDTADEPLDQCLLIAEDGIFSEASGSIANNELDGLTYPQNEVPTRSRESPESVANLGMGSKGSSVSSGPLEPPPSRDPKKQLFWAEETSMDNSKPLSDCSLDSRDKAQMRRDKNRESARKYRQRRKDYSKDLSGKLSTLEAEKQTIKESLSHLLEEARLLKKCADHWGLKVREVPNLAVVEDITNGRL